MIVFTICSRNFFAQAQVLHASLASHDNDLVFFVALCDQLEPLDRYSFPFHIIQIDELGVPDLDQMVSRYNITELNTALKPFVFRFLFDKHPGKPIVYLDPDILVLSQLDEVAESFADGANCILTPHLCEPREFAEMNEQRLLAFGAYNLGFCGLRDTEQVRRIVNWWARRLLTQCTIDLAAGLFVDQKWADFFPSFIDKTVILRHPGYNVAYWNLASRTVRIINGEWLSNGKPLRFFHFSGSVIDAPLIFSRHSTQFHVDSLRDAKYLFDQYVKTVHRFGRDYYKRIPYAFSWNGARGENLHTPKSVDRAIPVARGSAMNLGGDLIHKDPLPYLPLWRAASQQQHIAMIATLADSLLERRALEESLIPDDDVESFTVAGFCVVCGSEESLRVGNMYSTKRLTDGRLIPNWREHLDCPCCGFTSRLRASLHVFFQEFDPQPDDVIYVTEQVTPMFRWIKDHFSLAVGSEFLNAHYAGGDVIDGVRHEDLQDLSFPDAFFNYILSFDVLEHVPNHHQALRELARCLKPGGSLLMTAPFNDQLHEHDTRAELLENGEIRHYQEPEYHGNPVDENGALCYRYFGWQLLNDLRTAGFTASEVWHYWSNEYGYLGDTHHIIIARK